MRTRKSCDPQVQSFQSEQYQLNYGSIDKTLAGLNKVLFLFISKIYNRVLPGVHDMRENSSSSWRLGFGVIPLQSFVELWRTYFMEKLR